MLDLTATVVPVWQRAEKLASGEKGMKNTVKAKQRGIYEKVPGSGIWWVRFADGSGRIRREQVGSKSAAIQLYMRRKNQVREQTKLPEICARLLEFLIWLPPLRRTTRPTSKNPMTPWNAACVGTYFPSSEQLRRNEARYG